MWGDIAIAFMLAFIIAFVLTPYSIKLAIKVGAIDVPKDNRRVNKKAMPRLRRSGCNSWFSSISNISINYNEYRRYNRFIWRRYIL